MSAVVRPIDDKAFLRAFTAAQWWGEITTVRGPPITVEESDGFGLYDDDRLLAAATLREIAGIPTILTIGAIVRGRGAGSQLIERIVESCRDLGRDRLRAVLPNDHLEGLLYMQRRGFRFFAVWPGALDVLRGTQPAMPLVGRRSIRLCDVLELERTV
jgi:GNAT superfamily N-acetyltransferase